MVRIPSVCRTSPTITCPSNSCATLKVRCDGQAGISCTRCIASAQACVYRNTDKTGPLGVESSQTSTDLPPDPPGPSNIHELVQDAARRTASDVPPSPSHIDHANSVNPVYQTVESNSMVPASLQDSGETLHHSHFLLGILTTLRRISFQISLSSPYMGLL
jgi:hypothetical protein